MTTDKEIRAVALYHFQPDKEKLDNMLVMMERTMPQVQIRYNFNNPYDKTCMEIVLGLSVLGYVNADDKRYVEPLLRESNSCTADFFEVYREEGHAPVVRFLITVDLDDVEPLRPGEEWLSWNYTFPVIPMLDDLSTVTYAGDMLRDMLTKNLPEDYVTKDELVEAFVKASMFDMSVETSARYDDMLFYLETSRRRNRKYINILQHGATVRRTNKIRDKFLLEWWPQFLCSEVAKRLCKKYAVVVAQTYGSISEDIVKQEYEHIKSELILLPYTLYEKINDIKSFWAGLFYTKIPRCKFLEVLSALILYVKLRDNVLDKKPFIIEEVKNTYIQNYSSESKANVFNY